MLNLHVDYFLSGAVMQKYGVNAALVLNRIMVSINSHISNAERYEGQYYKDGLWWMSDGYEAISRFFRGAIAAITVKRCIKQLEADGILKSRVMDESFGNRTKWYAVDEQAWESLHKLPAVTVLPMDQNDRMGGDGIKKIHQTDPKDPVNGIKKIHSLSISLPKSPTENISPPPTGGSTQPTAGGTITRRKDPLSEEDLALGSEWLDYAKEAMPWRAPPAAWTPAAFGEGIKKLKACADLSTAGIRSLLRFVRSDEFWRSNALSPVSLLSKSKKGNRKIDNVLLAMRGSKPLKHDEKMADIRSTFANHYGKKGTV